MPNEILWRLGDPVQARAPFATSLLNPSLKWKQSEGFDTLRAGPSFAHRLANWTDSAQAHLACLSRAIRRAPSGITRERTGFPGVAAHEIGRQERPAPENAASPRFYFSQKRQIDLQLLSHQLSGGQRQARP